MPSLLTNLSAEQTRLTIGITAGIGAATIAGVYLYKKYRNNIPPTEWRRVGELSDLICYPIKSCGPINLNSIYCAKIGLKNGNLGDRTFMVVTTNGQVMDGGEHPKMTLVHPNIEGNKMTLSAPGMMDIEVDIERLYNMKTIRCRANGGRRVNAVDCGEEVARWFSRHILSEDYGLRLMFYRGCETEGDFLSKLLNFDVWSTWRTMFAFQEDSSILIFNESSVNDLNSRLGDPVQSLNFRPNIVIRGPIPYDEDNWTWVKIGNDVIFKSIMPCTRCKFTIVDPDSGKFRKDGDPLKTLYKYRVFKEAGTSPALGIHFGVLAPGTLSLGDSVFVGNLLTNLSAEQTGLTVGITAGIGAATVAGVYLYKKYRNNVPPTEWRRVGELSDLICYPIKSCGPINLNSIYCAKIGLKNGNLGDRTFMVVTTNGQIIDGGEHPKMTLVHPNIEGNKMTLSAPGMMDIEVEIERLYNMKTIRCRAYAGRPVNAVDCGEEVARWFSRYILSEDYGLRLMFYRGCETEGDCLSKLLNFDVWSTWRTTFAFQDESSILIFNESSVNHMNSLLEDPVQPVNFRPNIVIRGPIPYEEDNWTWVKIGNDVIFKSIMPCYRCKFTMVDPDSGKFRVQKYGDPLRTLYKYRVLSGSSPSLGVHFGVLAPGTLSLGDSVFVGSK